MRTRKLQTRSPIQIIREEDLEAIDDDFQANVQQVDSGVERLEERNLPHFIHPSTVLLFDYLSRCNSLIL